MKKREKVFFVVLMWMGILPCLAQTTNTGVLSVLENTQVTVLGNFTNVSSGTITNDGLWDGHGNMNNNGVFGYSAPTGSLNLVGTTQQSLSGSSEFNLYNLLINNSSNTEILLNNVLRTHGMGTFLEGVVAVDENIGQFVFEEFSDNTLASDDSHIRGKQEKLGMAPFVFPTGDNGYYRPIEISAPGVSSDLFETKYFFENSASLYPHVFNGMIEKVSDTEYWQLEAITGSPQVVVGLSYKLGVTPDFITSNLAAVRVVRWDATLSEWVDEGGVHDPSQGMIYTVASEDEYGIYTLALADSKLAGEEIAVYNYITPDGNGLNDAVIFGGLENFPENKVSIVNRWGETVFEMEGYDNESNVFTGYANRGITNTKASLPDGTYYYVVEYKKSGETIKKVGFLQILQN